MILFISNFEILTQGVMRFSGSFHFAKEITWFVYDIVRALGC